MSALEKTVTESSSADSISGEVELTPRTDEKSDDLDAFDRDKYFAEPVVQLDTLSEDGLNEFKVGKNYSITFESI